MNGLQNHTLDHYSANVVAMLCTPLSSRIVCNRSDNVN